MTAGSLEARSGHWRPAVGVAFGGGMSEVSLGIPIEDFAKMFNLTYEIDENKDDGCVYFKRQ